MDIKPWTEVIRLHPDVESEEMALSTYAIDLGALVAKDPSVPPTYRDAYSFFRATHLTSDIKRLVEEVYDRLSGKEGDRVLQLRSPFGGGKSHTLATLYYAVKNREEMEKVNPETKNLPKIDGARIAVFDGEKFDAVSGKEIGGKRVRTIWGYIAWQLESYEIIEEQDQKRVAPGGDIVKKIIGDKPTLILLDEVSRYLERSMGEKVGGSTLYRLVMDFIQTLTTEVSGSKNACLIYSLQASEREFFGNVEILKTLDHIASRVDAKREPIRGDEIFPVLRKRLLAEPPPEDITNKVADTYVETIKKNIRSYVSSDAERREVEERIIKYRERFVCAYPFHPALIDLMRERWASIPDFQRTRGVLRFLAVVLRTLKSRNAPDYLISANDIPMDEPEVRNAFFTEVGQREHFQAVLDKDFIGPNATIKSIDKIFPEVRNPATSVATSILMHSFGGQPKIEGKEGELLLPGVTEHDLMLACLSLNLDSTTLKATLRELAPPTGKCFYLHYDGVRYAFKTIPTVNLLVSDEAERIRDDEIKTAIKGMLESELSGKSAVIWPHHSKDIPEKVPMFQISYLPMEFVYEKNRGIEFLTQYGDRPRIYKNGVALALPDKKQIESLRRAVRYLIAVERVKGKRKSLNLPEQQIENLNEQERGLKGLRDSSLRNLYNTVWLLRIEDGSPALETIEVGGRALQATNIHERLMELLIRVPPPKVFDSLTAKKLLDLIKIEQGVKTQDIIDTFFSSLGFPRITDENVIKKAISKGIKDGIFGITNEDKVQIVKDKPVVAKEQVIIGKEVPEEEIDMSSGYIVSPEIIQIKEEPEPALLPKEEPKEPEKPKEGKITQVIYNFKVNRQQLYKCFEALGNLAEKSGELKLLIEAQTKEGIDANWLKNAVEEPIEEAGVEIKREE